MSYWGKKMIDHNASMPVLSVTKHEFHWVLELSRPDKRNALSAELVEALLQTLDEAESQQIKLLVLQGKGSNFSAGFDFTDYENQSEGDLVLRFIRIETLLQRIAYSSCETLALVHGANFGAGADLIASCTYRVCAEDSRFRMPGLKFGLVLGSRRLALLIGAKNARNILETTEIFDAKAALKMGFIEAFVTPQDWHQCIKQHLEKVQSLPDQSRCALKKQLLLGHQPEADMAALVYSASNPGIKARIKAFRTQ